MVAVGGRRQHLVCRGQGTPTVVLDAGLGGPWTQWARVQPEAARFSRVCAYDRAGLGWSYPGPLPRDSRRMAAELHALLQASGERGPFLLVGHSLGALNAWVFAARFPEAAAALALSDPPHLEAFPILPSEKVEQESASVLRAGRLQALAAHLGLVRLYATVARPDGFLASTRALPAEVQGPDLATRLRPARVFTAAAERAALRISATEALSTGNLGRMPVVVVASTRPDGSDPTLRLHRRLAARAPNFRLVAVPQSGHHIPLEAPGVLVREIRRLLETLREGGPR